MNKEERQQKKQKENRESFKMITLISQFGINMMVPIFLCFFIGYFLDKKLGTNYIVIIAFFVGAIAGFRNVYIFAKRMTTVPEDMDAKVREAAMENKPYEIDEKKDTEEDENIS